MLQILGIISDNASNNDSIIKYLGDALDKFPGPANQAQCFAHIINLIAKSILKPFEVWKKKDVQVFNNVVQALSHIAEGHQAAGDDSDDQPEDEKGCHGDDNSNNVDIDGNDNDSIDDELNASL
jgi:hypothetical protein